MVLDIHTHVHDRTAIKDKKHLQRIRFNTIHTLELVETMLNNSNENHDIGFSIESWTPISSTDLLNRIVRDIKNRRKQHKKGGNFWSQYGGSTPEILEKQTFSLNFVKYRILIWIVKICVLN